MYTENELITKAQLVLEKLSKGVNPLTGESIDSNNFILDPKLQRCFKFVIERLDNARPAPNEFNITDQQKQQIDITEETIGFSKFASKVNQFIDTDVSKKVSSARLLSGLKKMGVLGDKISSKGGRITITTPQSEDYGFITIHVTQETREYDQVVATKKGQQYIIDNLEKIINYES